MSELRIRIKLGEHEIELEGSASAVEKQFETFKQLLTGLSAPSSAPEATAKEPETSQAAEPLPLERILRARGTIYFLSVPAGVADAILVILLGQRFYRQNDNVSGIEIMQGLRYSRIDILRVDHIMMKYIRLGLVTAAGRHRRRRYRLTPAGVERAQ